MSRRRWNMDVVGADMPDLKAARKEAARTILGLLATEAAAGVVTPNLERAIDVRDEKGAILVSVWFSDVADAASNHDPVTTTYE